MDSTWVVQLLLLWLIWPRGVRHQSGAVYLPVARWCGRSPHRPVWGVGPCGSQSHSSVGHAPMLGGIVTLILL